jgi:hypothetical protein
MVAYFHIEAQVKNTAKLSPKVMVNQTVGLTEVSLEYQDQVQKEE